MFLIVNLIVFLAALLRLGITPVKTDIDPANPSGGVVGQQGAMPDYGGIVNLAIDLKTNAAPAFGNFGHGLYNGTTNTLLAGDIVGGIVKRYGLQSSNDLTDTATNIVNAIPGAVVGQTFPLFISNLTSASGVSGGIMTLQAGTGVTFIGTSTIDRSSTRLFMGRVTGSAAVSLTNCFQFPTPVL